MPTKYRKLRPDQLVTLAREVTAAARAVVDMATQMRAEGLKSVVSKGKPLIESHHFSHEARELNCAARAVVAMADPLREELFLAAKQMKATRRQKRKEVPKCGAWRASGGRCSTRLEPGEFRCPMHAADLRTRRLKRDGLKRTSQRGSSSTRRAEGHGSSSDKQQEMTPSCLDVSDGKVTVVDVGPSREPESGT